MRRSVVRDRPTAEHPDGEPIPEEGYSFIVSGSGPDVGFKVTAAAGSSFVGRRIRAIVWLLGSSGGMARLILGLVMRCVPPSRESGSLRCWH